MSKEHQYYIVEASALPEIFLKVAETNRLLESGEVSTINEATRITGISRSAFHKYRNTVRPFQNMMTGRVVTFQFMLHDQTGQLSSLLAVFSAHNANIQTVNTIIPTNGSALVTISAETLNLDISLEDLIREMRRVPGVYKAEVLAG